MLLIEVDYRNQKIVLFLVKPHSQRKLMNIEDCEISLAVDDEFHEIRRSVVGELTEAPRGEGPG